MSPSFHVINTVFTCSSSKIPNYRTKYMQCNFNAFQARCPANTQTKHCSIITQWASRKANSIGNFLTQSFWARESHSLWRGFHPWYLTVRCPIASLLLITTMNFLHKINPIFSTSLRSSFYILSSFVSNQAGSMKELKASGLFSPVRASSTEKTQNFRGSSVNTRQTNPQR